MDILIICMKILLIALMVLLLFTTGVTADILDPSRKYVYYCFTIENQDQYSDYTFILQGQLFTNKILKTGECITFYKYDTTKILAIKTVNFNQTEFEMLSDLHNQEEANRLINYFENNPYLLKSDLQLNIYPSLPKDAVLKQAKDILKIENINENNFIIKKEKIVYTYDDGSVEEKPYVVPGWPEPKSSKAIYLWYFGLPILSLSIIIYWRKKHE